MKKHELKDLAKTLTLNDVRQLAQYVTEYDQKWASLRPGQVFYEVGYDTDYFLQEIVAVNPNKREMVIKDHSLKGKLKTYSYIPSGIYDTKAELDKNTKKRW